MMKILSILSVSLTVFCGLSSAQLLSQNKSLNPDLHLSKIVFHSSRCNGLCPKLDLEIDSNKNIFVSREFYKTKSTIDKKNSGNFKGFVSNDNYLKLIVAIDFPGIDTLQFPDVNCCDGIITTIIIYYNGKRKYLKSMTPPQSAARLIWVLSKIGYDGNLEKTSVTKNIEY